MTAIVIGRSGGLRTTDLDDGLDSLSLLNGIFEVEWGLYLHITDEGRTKAHDEEFQLIGLRHIRDQTGKGLEFARIFRYAHSLLFQCTDLNTSGSRGSDGLEASSKSGSELGPSGWPI